MFIAERALSLRWYSYPVSPGERVDSKEVLHVLLGEEGRLAGRSQEHSANPQIAPCPVGHNVHVKHVLARIGTYRAMVCGHQQLCGTMQCTSHPTHEFTIRGLLIMWSQSPDFVGPSQPTHELTVCGSWYCCFVCDLRDEPGVPILWDCLS